jgi:hypothetical protein
MDIKKMYVEYSLEPLSHLIVLFPYENSLYGLASFYGGQFVRAIKLLDSTEENNYYIFSCDWKNNLEKEFKVEASKVGRYFISHQEAHREEELKPDTVLGRKVDTRVSNLIYELESSYPKYKYFIEFNSDQSVGFSNVKFSDKFKAGLVQINWSLDDVTYNEVLVQTFTFILNNNDQLIVTVEPKNTQNQGEVVIASYLNQLLTLALQDSIAYKYNYDPSNIYSIRNMQLISKIINYNEKQFQDDFIVAKLSIEIAILLIYSESFVDEYKYLVGQRNMRIIENAHKIRKLCIKNEVGNKNQRRTSAKEILKLLNIDNHITLIADDSINNNNNNKKEL